MTRESLSYQARKHNISGVPSIKQKEIIEKVCFTHALGFYIICTLKKLYEINNSIYSVKQFYKKNDLP